MKYKSQAGESLFCTNTTSEKLPKEKAEAFHTTVAQALFVSKRSCPDIQTIVAYLCTRIREPTKEDANKLHRMMCYLAHTPDQVLTLEADNEFVLKCWVDAAYAVHNDMRSHTGAMMSIGKGALQSKSTKQKINTRSSTESELVATDDMISQILWTKNFLEAQGYPIRKTIVYQDNKSTILLQKNGRASAGKRSRHLKIKYFFITDQVSNGKIEIEYCPTDDMTADFFTKPLHGSKFEKFKKEIMN